MKRHKPKRKAEKSAVKQVHGKTQLTRLLVAIVIAGGILLIAWPKLFPRKPAAQTAPAQTNRESSLAMAREVMGAPAAPDDPTAPGEGEISDAEKSTQCLNRGTKLLEAGKVDEAAAQYQEAARLNPENEDAHFNLGVALARQGHREDAKAQYLEALRIYPDYTDADNNLGNLLVAEGKFDDAISRFRAALKVAADEAATHNNLGKALALQGKMNEAMASFHEALRLKPDYPEARCNLAVGYMSGQHTNEALAELTNILSQHPDFQPAQRVLNRIRQAGAQ